MCYMKLTYNSCEKRSEKQRRKGKICPFECRVPKNIKEIGESNRMGKTEKAMAPHSSVLAWKIPWTEEPGRLQTTESLRVGND